MTTRILTLTGLAVAMPVNFAFAGGFYRLTPYWLGYIYQLLLLGLIFIGVIVSFSVYRSLRDGNLGRPWLFIMLALIVIMARSVLGTLTVFNIAFFQATLFAGLDVLFYILLLIGLFRYKVGLN